MAQVLDDGWFHAYATLALRIDRHLAASGGTSLIYTGPEKWRAAVAAEKPVPPARLAEHCESLREDIPVDGRRGAFLAAQLTAMRATVLQLDDVDIPFLDHARHTLGLPIDRAPEDLFADAHTRLAAALPPASGLLVERLKAWQQAHAVPAERLPGLARRAIAETVTRTREIVELRGTRRRAAPSARPRAGHRRRRAAPLAADGRAALRRGHQPVLGSPDHRRHRVADVPPRG